MTVGGLTVAAYVYDGDGGRTQKTVYRRDLALYNDNTNALLFGSISNPLPATAQNPAVDTTLYVGNVYESESATGLSRQTKYIYMGSTRIASVGSDGSIFYYHTDHLGGTNVLTDNTGEVRELTEYDPFGQVIVHEKYGNNYATAWYYFTGKPLDDETGLVYLGARYYNPSLGRFITPDTVVQAPSNPQTLNRYTYCNNNPVNLIDPTGHSWFSKLFKSIGKIFTNIIKAIAPYIGFAGIVLSDAVTGNWSHFGQQFESFAIGFAVSLLMPGIGELSSNLFLNILGGAVIGAFEGAVAGGITSAIMGGSFAKGAESGAMGGAIGGAINGFTSSEQFQNWQQTGRFASNADTYTLTAVVNNASASAPDVAQGAASIANSANNAGDTVCGPENGGAGGSWDNGLSAGTIVNGSFDGGVGAGSSATYSSGNGYFSGSGNVNFNSSGSISGVGNSNAWVIGGSIGINGGAWISNAGNNSSFEGPFMTTTVNSPGFSFTYATSGQTWFGSLSTGPGAGLSVSHYVTTTKIEN